MCNICFFRIILIIITVNNFIYRTKAFRMINDNGVENILALENEKIDIECEADIQMKYCGFIHPTGKRYSFTGDGTYDAGKCSIKINATSNDTGTWRCHIGSQLAGEEIMKNFQLRVVGEIAAVYPNVTAVHGQSKTLYCTTTKGFKPLRYCRFEPPNSQPFSIDSSATEIKPVLKRYYFPHNKSLDRGDCAVTITRVRYSDLGQWTCGAGLDDGKEYIDIINFKVEGPYTVTRIVSIVIATVGGITLFGLAAHYLWKNHRFLGGMRRAENVEIHELQQLPSTSSSQPVTPQGRVSVPTIVIKSPSLPSEPGSRSPLVAEGL